MKYFVLCLLLLPNLCFSKWDVSPWGLQVSYPEWKAKWGNGIELTFPITPETVLPALKKYLVDYSAHFDAEHAQFIEGLARGSCETNAETSDYPADLPRDLSGVVAELEKIYAAVPSDKTLILIGSPLSTIVLNVLNRPQKIYSSAQIVEKIREAKKGEVDGESRPPLKMFYLNSRLLELLLQYAVKNQIPPEALNTKEPLQRLWNNLHAYLSQFQNHTLRTRQITLWEETGSRPSAPARN